MLRLHGESCAIIGSASSGTRKAMNGAPRPASTGPQYPGCSNRKSPKFRNDVPAPAGVRAQLPMIQQLTGNKTFPVVCDQYTNKQSPPQMEFPWHRQPSPEGYLESGLRRFPAWVKPFSTLGFHLGTGIPLLFPVASNDFDLSAFFRVAIPPASAFNPHNRTLPAV